MGMLANSSTRGDELKRNSINMLEGPLLSRIFSYTVPIILSGVLQLLFNAVDLVVVSNWGGDEALAAVSATGSLITLITNLFMGLSVGAGITVARSLGQGRYDDVQKTIHTAVPIAIISGIILTVIGVVFSEYFLELMGTDEDVIKDAALYMRIYFCGITFSMLYNFGAAILRATGDTQGPLIYLTISGIANVVLNIFFVTVFNMTVDGVAIATVISLGISTLLTYTNLIKRTDECRLNIKKLCIDKRALASIVRIGLPSGIQGALFSISNVLIQSSINSFGDIAMAGNGAANSIEGFIYTSMNAFSHTTQNFVSQNYGAKKFKRIKKVTLLSIIMVTVIGAGMGGVIYLFRAPLVSIYTDNPVAANYAYIKLLYVGVFYFLCGIMETIAGTIRGLGSSVTPMIVSLIGACLLRIVWILTVFEQNRTFETLFLSYPVTWIITIAMHTVVLLAIYKKKKKAAESEAEQPAESKA